MNSNIDKQDGVARLARVEPDEVYTQEEYLRDINAAQGATPDFVCEPVAQESEPQPYEGAGFPGSGDGSDDLADLMAHGDLGCCD